MPQQSEYSMNLNLLADNIDIFTAQFEAHIIKHGLDEKVCDFFAGGDERCTGEPICNTPACHAGEIAIMYDELGELMVEPSKRFYMQGAATLATALGFGDQESMTDFFGYNPELWGGDDGDLKCDCGTGVLGDLIKSTIKKQDACTCTLVSGYSLYMGIYGYMDPQIWACTYAQVLGYGHMTATVCLCAYMWAHWQMGALEHWQIATLAD